MASSNGPDGPSLPRLVQREWTDDDEIGVVIVEALADLRERDPADVDFQLYDHVDPDVLDALRDHSERIDDTRWEIEFSVGRFDVSVQSDGRILVL